MAPTTGVVVGAWLDCATAEGNHSFLWPPGGDGIQPIPYPPGINHMNGYDITDAGWVVGGMGPGSDQEIYAFLHKDGVTIDLGSLPGARQTIAEAVASDGTVVGRWNNGQAFKWREGVMTDLTPILGTGQGGANDISADGRFIAGWGGSDFATDARAFILDGERVMFLPLPPVPGAFFSEAKAVNSQGDACGRFVTSTSHAFAYLNGSMIVLSEPPGTNGSIAYDLNDWFVVGDAGMGHGSVWTSDGAVHDLNDLISRGSNVIVKHARAISDSGIITGSGESQVTYTTVAVRLTPVWPRVGDFNCDQIVNGFDLAMLLGQWGSCRTETCSGDLSKDGIVNGIDLALLLSQWG